MPKQLKSMPRYEMYKDSGIEWLGKIPEHWGLCRLKHRTLINPPIRLSGRERNEKACFLPMESVSVDGQVDCCQIKEVKDLMQGFTGFRRDDVIVAKITPCFENGKGACLRDLPTSLGFGSTEFHVLRGDAKTNTKYLYYLTKSDVFMKVGEQMMTGSAGQKRVPTNFISNFVSAFPPLNEQTVIANFLDQKIVQIDEAMKIKEKQIALLKERKQIMIQNAVTRGLNPKVPMRDSGVEWIGEMPVHWNVKRLKYVVQILKRIVGFEGPDVLSITQQGIKVKDIESGEGQLAMDYSKYQLVSRGDFAMNHMDLLTGYVDISGFDGVVSPDYRVFKNVSNDVNDRYLLTIFQVGYKQKIFYRYGQGVSLLGRWRFPADNFNNFIIPIPSLEEQISIVTHIETESGKIDNTINLQQQQIDRLNEYKATLINSAVTGKIKVA